ncbi:reverse transcriptase family protein [Mediterraneibacter agrestimuris]|uniref:reverse transcriptase family protein n=1 Tax=Mediterraneibacter agrestimuris TaxID=2941333 RepID=UPI0020412C86|nr:reverse transcriptase family protein [Mediterraneibacter agrestimuris]
MSEYDLWKYCTSEHVKAVLRSFDLLSGIPLDKEKELAYLYAVSNHTENHYHQVQIPKRKGGMRHLCVPDDLLCTIQRNILRNVLCEFSPSAYAAAYKKKTSVLYNARPHVGAKQIVKLDIKDFFENISYSLAYQHAFPATHFPPPIRRILTELCCFRDYLPQGAPTSPAISNLVMKPFDEYMGEWCKERDVCYSRYCDDLTFSGEKMNAKELIGKVRGFLHAYGFELNNKKTRILKQNVRQSVTGIVVNEKPQVSREYRRNLRQELYYCRKFGVESHLRRKYAECDGRVDCTGKRNENKEFDETKNSEQEIFCQKYLQKLLGKISYVCLVNPEDAEFQKARGEVIELMQNIK